MSRWTQMRLRDGDVPHALAEQAKGAGLVQRCEDVLSVTTSGVLLQHAYSLIVVLGLILLL